MPDVTDLIQAAAKRRQPTGGEILTLASGGSSSSRPTRTTTSRSTRSTTRSSSAKSSTPRAKAPCKYGPRDADGRCPRKPSTARNTGRSRTSVTARTTAGATKQATDVLLNPRATAQQKGRAIEKAAEVTGTEVVKSTIRKTVTPKRIEQGKQFVKEKGPQLLELLKQGVVVAGEGKMYHEAKKQVSAAAKADWELRQTEKRMKRKLTKKEADTLRKQYREYFTKNPNAPNT